MSAPPVVANPLGNLNTSLPSTRKIHNFIREKAEITVKMVTGEQFTGRVQWLDEHCIALTTGEQNLILWIHAIAFLHY
jgi:host factor-I protein